HPIKNHSDAPNHVHAIPQKEHFAPEHARSARQPQTPRRKVTVQHTCRRIPERHYPMAKPVSHPHLTDEQFADLLKLAGKSDSIELKLTVPEDSYSATARALGMDPLEAQIRQVFFFDTPDLTLNHAGV